MVPAIPPPLESGLPNEDLLQDGLTNILCVTGIHYSALEWYVRHDWCVSFNVELYHLLGCAEQS